MSEFHRVLLSKRIIVITTLCVLLCCVFFSFELTNENVTLSGEALWEYIEGYPEFIEKINENAENSAMLSAFGENAGYIRANAKKTVADYSRLSGNVLKVADNTVVTAFSGFVVADAAVIAVVIAVIICFSEEKSKGLSNVIRCTKSGRAALSLERSGIILAAAVVTSLATTAFCILTGIILRGSIDLNTPLQSVPEFSFCALPINILEYLVLSVFIKALGAAVFGLLAQLALTFSGGIFSLGIAGLFYLIESVFFTAVSGADRLAWMKIANVIPLLFSDFFFKNYYNVNLFGKAVGFLPYAVVMMTVLCILLIVVSAILSEKIKGGEVIIPVIVRINQWISKALPNPPIFFWELKKILINQKGLVIIAAAIYFSVSSVTKLGYFIPEQSVRDNYYQKYAGEITPEKLDAMQAELNEIIVSYREFEKEYMANLNNEQDPHKQLVLANKLNALGDKWNVLEPIIAEAQSAWEVTSFRGIKTELVKPDTYELLLSRDKSTTDKISLFILLCIIGVFSDVYSREVQSDMICVLRTLKNGRGVLLKAKLGVAALTAPLLSAGSFATQFFLIGIRSGYNDLGASVQSIELLRHIPFEITLGGYLTLIILLRMFFTFMLCVIIMLISSHCKNRVSSLAVCSGMIALPTVLSITGVIPVPSVLDLIGCVI